MKEEQLIEWFREHELGSDKHSHKICSLIYEIMNLRDVIKEYDLAAQKFVNKVDNGLARSVETYKDMKNALSYSRSVLKEDEE